jgi:2-C-methyl-D-erythritol 4-phosphate cytidylyltransferase
VIVGAGEGKRMGATARKQFVKIAGRPIIAYTLDVFEKTPLVDHMVIVVPRDAIDWVRDDIVEAYGYKKVHAIVYGGETRQESVYNGLKALKPGTETVLVHDAVRPLVSETLIRRVMDAARTTGAAITAVPPKETVKRVESGDIVGTLDRRLLWLAQTPQCFRFDLIMNAHTRAAAEKIEATDDAALLETSGIKVAVAVGSYSNLKMTSPEDLPMFEYFLADQVKAKIDSAVDQGGRAGRAGRGGRESREGREGRENREGREGREGRPRHRRRRPRRRGVVGAAEPAAGGRPPQEQGHDQARDHAREPRRERSGEEGRGPGRRRRRPRGGGVPGEQPREGRRDRGRERPRPPRREGPRETPGGHEADHGRDSQLRHHSGVIKFGQDRDGIRHT